MDCNSIHLFTVAADMGVPTKDTGFLVTCRLDGGATKRLLEQWMNSFRTLMMGEPAGEALGSDPIDVEVAILARLEGARIDRTHAIDESEAVDILEDISLEHPHRTSCTWKQATSVLRKSASEAPSADAEILPSARQLHHSLKVDWTTELGLRKELHAHLGLSLVAWKEILGSRFEEMFGDVDFRNPHIGVEDQKAGFEMHSRMLMSIARRCAPQADPEPTGRTINLR